MYVYLGKLNWKGAAEATNETFVVVLPNGSVRAGDTAYVFFQWTKDQYGANKTNWFQRLYIDEVSQNKNGDDVFTLNHHKFAWTITSQKAYEKLQVNMAGPKSSEAFMDLERVWGTHSHGGKAKDTARIWTGKINWHQYATNEMAIFIVPEGFGEGRPVVSLWQWTKSDSGKSKDPSLHCEYQTIKSQTKDSVKFTYHSYYDVTCTWNRDTDKLAVHMSSPNTHSEPAKELGEFTIVGKFGRHSHDFHPPESKPNKAEVEFRLPQPQATLPRVLTPMPFPRTLFETLTHTAAFVDQAGYLAKCAEEEFKILLAHHESSGQKLATAKASIKGLNKSIKQNKRDLDAEKAKSADLAKTLQEAKAKAEADKKDFQDQLAHLAKTNKEHDQKDHGTIERLENELKKSREAEKDLEIKLSKKSADLAAAEARLKAEEDLNRELGFKKIELEEALNVQLKRNNDLQDQNIKLKLANEALETKVADLQKDLASANKDLRKAEANITDLKREALTKDSEISGYLAKITSLENVINVIKGAVSKA